MILDMSTAFSMLLGAVLGWGILSPIARNHGWALGPVASMETGVRGWLIWISIGFLLGDAAIRVLEGCISFLMRFYHGMQHQKLQSYYSDASVNYDHPSLQPLVADARTDDNNVAVVDRNRQNRNLISTKVITCWFAGSTLLCIACTSLIFRHELALYLIILAVAISFPLCLIVIQSTGETDTAPSNSLSESLPSHAIDHYVNLLR